MSDTRLLTERFDQALLYASQVHADQRRKGTEIPYVAHQSAPYQGAVVVRSLGRDAGTARP